MDEEKQIDVGAFAYDLNAIMDFVLQNKNKSSEIREIYEKNAENGSLELKQKSLAEVKNEEMPSAATIRYDLVKRMMEQINGIIMHDGADDMFLDDEDESEPSVDDEEGERTPVITSLGETIAINTMLNEGMLINVNIENLVKND